MAVSSPADRPAVPDNPHQNVFRLFRLRRFEFTRWYRFDGSGKSLPPGAICDAKQFAEKMSCPWQENKDNPECIQL